MGKKKGAFSDLADLAQVVIICCIISVCLAVAYVVLLIITYWYISIPAMLAIGYFLLNRKKEPEAETPTSKTVITRSKEKTGNAVIRTHTTATYGKDEGSITKALHIIAANIK